MRSSERYIPRPQAEIETVPFNDVEEAWFWFPVRASRWIS